MAGKFRKTSQEILDYTISAARWIPDDDALTLATAEVEAGTVEVDEVLVYADDANVVVWVSGGADGEAAKIVVTMQTEGGRTKQEALIISVKDL